MDWGSKQIDTKSVAVDTLSLHEPDIMEPVQKAVEMHAHQNPGAKRPPI
jgi:hypothetical protein